MEESLRSFLDKWYKCLKLAKEKPLYDGKIAFQSNGKLRVNSVMAFNFALALFQFFSMVLFTSNPGKYRQTSKKNTAKANASVNRFV